jgi:hypothetical protein
MPEIRGEDDLSLTEGSGGASTYSDKLRSIKIETLLLLLGRAGGWPLAGSVGLRCSHEKRRNQRQRRRSTNADLLHHLPSTYPGRDKRQGSRRFKQPILRQALQSELDYLLIDWLIEELFQSTRYLGNCCLPVAMLPDKRRFLIEAERLVALLVIDHQLGSQLFDDQLVTPETLWFHFVGNYQGVLSECLALLTQATPSVSNKLNGQAFFFGAYCGLRKTYLTRLFDRFRKRNLVTNRADY